jgi:hypothetical protein
MTKIELFNGYYIEVDDMNCTLRQRYIGEKKNGEKKDAERTIGYYKTVADALERFIRLNRIDKMNGMELSLTEYINEIKKEDTEVMEFLQGLKGV